MTKLLIGSFIQDSFNTLRADDFSDWNEFDYLMFDSKSYAN